MGRRVRDARPSPAIVVAAVALGAALAGSALADTDATTSAINKKKVKKIATKQVNKLAPGLSVAHADTADTAGTADSAADAARLGGRGPASFLSAARVKSGAAHTAAVPAETIFRWPERDITIETDGDADSDATDLQICARNDAGTGSIGMHGQGPGGFGTGARFCSHSNNNQAGTFIAWRVGDPRTLFITCGTDFSGSTLEVRCIGVDSP